MKNKNIVSMFMLLILTQSIHSCMYDNDNKNKTYSSINAELIARAKSINAAAIKKCLQYGADANYQDLQGNTPLHYLTQAIIDNNWESSLTAEIQYTQAKWALWYAGARMDIYNKNIITAQDILSGKKNIDDRHMFPKIRGSRNARWW